VADSERVAPRDVEGRIRLLTGTYRELLERYGEIEELTETERRILTERGSMAEVNGILQRKHEILREIRVGEERVMGAREWWKKVRRTLAPERGRELLSLLDAISRRMENILALENECRDLLARATAWGLGGLAGRVRTIVPPTAVTSAYGRVAPRAAGGGGR
jgi:hypothetical protein